MDQTFEPANASWEIKIDTVVQSIDTQVWLTATTLEITLDPGPAPSDHVRVQLLVQDPALHSDHLIPVLPFGPVDIAAA